MVVCGHGISPTHPYFGIISSVTYIRHINRLNAAMKIGLLSITMELYIVHDA